MFRPALRQRVRFDRNELAGAFGDIGTDLPLLLAMIPAAGLDAGSVFAVFGGAQILTGLLYGLPMPMQPLKAMAVIVIAAHVPARVLFGGGLAIGIVMSLLTVTGVLQWLVRVIPRAVVRGVQLGLALSLGQLALTRYVPSMGALGYGLAAVCVLIILVLFGSRRLPPALPVIVVGMAVSAASGLDGDAIARGFGLHLPTLHTPTVADVTTGFVLLALPQLPLSISNSVIATHRTIGDLFPDRDVSVRKIGLSYALANLIAPLLGGVPVCHGSGGLVGHYTFGGRTGGTVVIYGGMFLALGLLFGDVVSDVVRLFPLPVLGVILLFEAIALGSLARDVLGSRRSVLIAVIVAVCAVALPQGYVIGLLVGLALHHYPGFMRESRDAHDGRK